ncbi:MAG TPA: sugar transferase [Clostridia bacterium]|jgi:lipopolysaccharide/colanic/teichoic acid biosynthesis glycosyltransferase|nr:sugar transferase [Clostridia bacterium]
MYKHIKPVLDVFFGFIGTVFMLPVFLIIIIAIKIDSKGPAIFKQERTGKNGKVIQVYKFRSMYTTDVAFDKERPVIADGNKNVTKVGRFLRKFKLDESIQVVNIMCGQMSYIGPRPLRTEYYEEYSEWEKKKLNVKPGLSGLAQIKGGGYLNIKERNYYDAYYAEHLSFFKDIELFFKTLILVIKGEAKYVQHVEPEKIKELEEQEGKTYDPSDYDDPTAKDDMVVEESDSKE